MKKILISLIVITFIGAFCLANAQENTMTPTTPAPKATMPAVKKAKAKPAKPAKVTKITGTVSSIDTTASTITVTDKAGTMTTVKVTPVQIKKITQDEKVTFSYTTLASGELKAGKISKVTEKKAKKAAKKAAAPAPTAAPVQQ